MTKESNFSSEPLVKMIASFFFLIVGAILVDIRSTVNSISSHQITIRTSIIRLEGTHKLYNHKFDELENLLRTDKIRLNNIDTDLTKMWDAIRK